MVETPSEVRWMSELPSRCRELAGRNPQLRERYLEARRGRWPTLLSSSVKTDKGLAYGIRTGVLYLSPSAESGIDVCPAASPACRALCLGRHSGRMTMPTHRVARIIRTWLFVSCRDEFMRRLDADISALERRASREGNLPYVRLNGASDVAWEREAPWIFTNHRGVTFYDYTKRFGRMVSHLGGLLPSNYHLTFSRSEANEPQVESLLDVGANVAVAFRDLPAATKNGWHGRTVVDGDRHDGRPNDEHGVVVGLSAKGAPARRAPKGFVVH